MKAHVALFLVGILFFAIDASIYDLVPSLRDEKFVKAQVECILNDLPNCHPMVNALKPLLPEALKGCDHCPATYKKLILELTELMKTGHPAEYNQIYERYVRS